MRVENSMSPWAHTLCTLRRPVKIGTAVLPLSLVIPTSDRGAECERMARKSER